ncbi:MAG: type II toxin-antitoxin system VapC family toxin [Propioniciclava sp.]|uniref:type II toxin-antitoxin system VapC family toxin n=1 Tax=Propioniciclava sp. TaxID=2038686 RepID=UPI0039E62730
MLVVDSSLLLSSLLPDEAGPDLEELFDSYDEVTAPWLLWVELRNILLVAERRGRLPAGSAEEILEVIDELGIALDQTPRSASVMRLARRHDLSAYDALYLELALHRDATLATLDQRLQKAAAAEGVRLAVG